MTVLRNRAMAVPRSPSLIACSCLRPHMSPPGIPVVAMVKVQDHTL